MAFFDFGFDLWIELITSNNFSNQDIFNLGVTCKFFSQLFKNEKVVQFIKDRTLHFGSYQHEDQEWCLAVAWRPDNRVLAVSNSQGKIFLWNVNTGQILKILDTKEPSIHGLAFHPLNTNLLVANHHFSTLCLWNIEKDSLEVYFVGHKEGARCFAFHPQGRFLASGGWDFTVRIWNTETGNAEQELVGLEKGVTCVGFTHDGKFLGASTLHSNIFIWNFRQGNNCQLLHKFHPQGVYDSLYFRFLKDNMTIAFVSAGNSRIYFYDFHNRTEKKEREINTQTLYMKSIEISHPNEKLIACGSYNFVIWDQQEKKRLERIQSSDYWSFSPDGKALAVTFRTQGAKILDMRKYLC